jgi:hypothetical protein
MSLHWESLAISFRGGFPIPSQSFFCKFPGLYCLPKKLAPVNRRLRRANEHESNTHEVSVRKGTTSVLPIAA